MRLVLKATRLGLRNSTTRIPFRYGNTCLSHCPQAVLEATIETGGKVVRGYSGDCLPPGWFDKTPGRSFADQIDDMLAVIRRAEDEFLDSAHRPKEFVESWRLTHSSVHAWARDNHYSALLASFGVSLVERAVMDAMCRAAGLSFDHQGLGVDVRRTGGFFARLMAMFRGYPHRRVFERCHRQRHRDIRNQLVLACAEHRRAGLVDATIVIRPRRDPEPRALASAVSQDPHGC